MTDMNSVCLMGRITHDVGEHDFGYVGENAKLTLSIAVNYSHKSGDEWVNDASFFDIEIWGKRAESLKNLVGKGKQIAVKGSLKQNRWEKDGKKFSKVFVLADEIQLIGNKSDDSSETASTETFKKSKATKDDLVPPNMKKYMNKPQKEQEETQEDFPEDLPF